MKSLSALLLLSATMMAQTPATQKATVWIDETAAHQVTLDEHLGNSNLPCEAYGFAARNGRCEFTFISDGPKSSELHVEKSRLPNAQVLTLYFVIPKWLPVKPDPNVPPADGSEAGLLDGAGGWSEGFAIETLRQMAKDVDPPCKISESEIDFMYATNPPTPGHTCVKNVRWDSPPTIRPDIWQTGGCEDNCQRFIVNYQPGPQRTLIDDFQDWLKQMHEEDYAAGEGVMPRTVVGYTLTPGGAGIPPPCTQTASPPCVLMSWSDFEKLKKLEKKAK